MTNDFEPLVINLQIQPDGSSSRYELRQVDGEFILTGHSEECAGRGLGPVADGIDEALRQAPELLRVGIGVTDIHTSQEVDLHEFLGLLKIDDPDAPEPNPEKWTGEARQVTQEIDVDIDEWHAAADQLRSAVNAPEGLTLVPRWLRIDGERAFVVTGPDFAAVGVLDPESDWDCVGSTREMLGWSFYRESGGPCSWDGSAELGWCGPRMWSFSRRGDIEPTELVFPAPPAEFVAQELTNWILHLDWELPFLIATIGLPGLTKEDRDAWVRSTGRAEGDDVTSHLPAELASSVIAEMCTRHPELQEAVDGLRNPESERGKLIYAWVRQIIHGPAQSGSWDQVVAAMLGQIEPPAEDQRAPTMAERWDETTERAAGEIRAALGQPQPVPEVPIPDEVIEAVDAALNAHLPAQLRDAIARDERNASLIGDARSLLGVRPGERHVLRKVRALVEQDPNNADREADLWSAYWVIHEWDTQGGDDGRDTYLAELQKLLRQTESEAGNAKEAGWPEPWPAPLMQVWLKHGGSIESARSWAAAGWTAAEVLTSPCLSETWNPEFDNRLSMTDPIPASRRQEEQQ